MTAEQAHEVGLMTEVLVVDDEALIRWSLNEALSAAGFKVSEASDGRTALSRVDAGDDISVVLLDLRLPDTDGLTLLPKITSHCPTARVVLMTAYGSPETTETALRLGAYRVINKPFDLNRMVGLVREVLETRPTG